MAWGVGRYPLPLVGTVSLGIGLVYTLRSGEPGCSVHTVSSVLRAIPLLPRLDLCIGNKSGTLPRQRWAGSDSQEGWCRRQYSTHDPAGDAPRALPPRNVAPQRSDNRDYCPGGGLGGCVLTHDGNHLRNTARTHPAIPGDDVAMALDYRTDPADPRVVASDFWTDPKRCSWQAVTPSFSQLVEVLRLV